MRWIPNWLVWLLGDDRNLLHPEPMPTLKCVTCQRFVRYKEKSLCNDEFVHADDATPICQPIGIYRA